MRKSSGPEMVRTTLVKSSSSEMPVRYVGGLLSAASAAHAANASDPSIRASERRPLKLSMIP